MSGISTGVETWLDMTSDRSKKTFRDKLGKDISGVSSSTVWSPPGHLSEMETVILSFL
jgi:hypothetical protein